MLVGDSITSGQTLADGVNPDRSGQWPTYRGPLYAELTSAGRSFDFVGSQDGVGTNRDGQVLNCPSTDPDREINAFGQSLECEYATRIGGGIQNPLIDPHHEGHDGWTIDELSAQLQGWMNTHAPDIVVFFGGTNDLNEQPPPSPLSAVNRVKTAIGIMRAANPNVRIVVPTLLPHKNTQNRTTANKDFNDALTGPGGVASMHTAASPVIVVDIFSGYCSNTHPDSRWDSDGAAPVAGCDGVQYQNDGSHPNPIGGQFIAKRLGDAMQTKGFFAPLPAPPAPPPPPPPPPSSPGSGGYFLVEQDGDLYAFGTARAKLRAIDPGAVDNNSRGATVSGIVKPRLGGAEAVEVESTADGKGLWVLLSNGRIVNLGSARAAPGVSPATLTKVVAGRPERPAALAGLGNGDLWVFTTAGRIVPQFGSLPAKARAAMNQVLAANLVGPILDAKPTRNGTGAYATGSDGGVFAYNAPFRGSVPEALAGIGRTTPDQPVVGITVDPDGTGYWLVAQDGGVFAFLAPFRGALPAVVPFFALVSPVNGMVPFGNGYLLVAGDGGVFTFSNRPFSGSAAGLVDTTVVGITPT